MEKESPSLSKNIGSPKEKESIIKKSKNKREKKI
jgi:hypothetical protein